MKTILFVCTGNTCRSPMAVCLFNALCEKTGCDKLFCAMSAGISAMGGMPASDGAKHAMAQRGFSLEDHHSRPLTAELLRGASLVVGMSQSHIDAIRMRFSTVGIPMCTFAPPISDPYGGNDAVYEHAAQEIERQLPNLLQEGKLER